MKCPVCKTELLDSTEICNVCKFSDLHRVFINSSDAAEWMESTVIPYRNQWKQPPKTEDLFQTMFSQQLCQLKTVSKNESANNCDFKYKPYGIGIEITSYVGTDANVIIPDNIDGNIVCRIAAKAFEGCQIIKSVTLPNTIISIGYAAFEGSSLTNIELGENISEIEFNAFSYCEKLKSITFPESLKIIPDRVCTSCENLETVIILGAEEIGDSAFSSTNIKNLYLPETLKEISYSCFNNKSYQLSVISRLILPQSLQSLKDESFILYNNGLDVAVLNDDMQFNSFLYSGSKCKTRIFCNKGSTAQTFANRYNIPTFPLSEFPQN